MWNALFGRKPATAPTPIIPLIPYDEKVQAWFSNLETKTRKNSYALSPTVYSTLRFIADILRPVVPQVAETELTEETRIELQSLLTDYLIAPMDIYVGLPEAQRQDGGEADLLLIAQYDTLVNAAIEMSKRFKKDGLQALQVHSIFINDKFGNL